MRAIAVTLAAFIAFVGAEQVRAQTTMVHAAVNCSNWPKQKNNDYVRGVVHGVLTGMSISYWAEHTSVVGQHGVDPLAALTSVQEVYKWLDNHCAKEADAPIPIALLGLFTELEAKRKTGSK